MYVDRVERHLVRPADSNYQACVRLCQSAKRLGNCAVYTLRHNLFDNQPFLRASDLDKHLREKYESDYRDMPSAAAAQRQGQIIAENLKLSHLHLESIKNILKNLVENQDFLDIKGSIGHL